MLPFFIYQMAMEPRMERKPRTAQALLKRRKVSLFIVEEWFE